MNSELIEAIRELGKTSLLDIISVGIGIIGTFLTLIVLYYNHKSIQLTQKTMQQAIGLQLYEKRLELYNAITDEQAFYVAPLSLKIAYNQEVYNLYSDIVELCEKRWENIYEFAVRFGVNSLYKKAHGNICCELYEEYIKAIKHQIQLRKTGHLSDVDKKNALVLEKHKEDADLMHQEICKKHAELEEKMRTILNQSMKV